MHYFPEEVACTKSSNSRTRDLQSTFSCCGSGQRACSLASSYLVSPEPQHPAGSSVTSAVSENTWFVQRSYRVYCILPWKRPEIQGANIPTEGFFMMYSEELKELWNLESLVCRKWKHKYRILCSTSSTEHTLCYTFKHWAMFRCTSSILELKNPPVWTVLTSFIRFSRGMFNTRCSKGRGRGRPCQQSALVTCPLECTKHASNDQSIVQDSTHSAHYLIIIMCSKPVLQDFTDWVKEGYRDQDEK